MSREILQRDGPAVSTEITLNGRQAVDVRVWRPDTDQPLLVDAADIVRATARQRLLDQLPDEVRSEVGVHLLELADAVIERRQQSAVNSPSDSAATLQPGPTDTERAQVWEQCKSLAGQADLLELASLTIEALGVAGARRLVALIYLVLTSRLLDKPVSLAIKGPSSAGKSFPLEQALRLFPPETHYAITAMSERSLAYGTEPLCHRTIILYEAAGLGDFASYLMRSLLSEGRLCYETVEKTDDGLQVRKIEREGPTGLIVTTTRSSLHPENETRMLSVTVSDTPEQTRVVLLAVATDRRTAFDATAWHSLQRWLAMNNGTVEIPYAERLATLIPPVAVRLRRDFRTFLSLIRAHAMLHQASRTRTPDGVIVATLGDYSAVRALVGDLLADGVETTVSPTMRQTVETVRRCRAQRGESAEVTVAEVARVLDLDKSSAWRRVRAAIDKGYITNNETGRGRPARLVLGDDLPEDRDLFPSVTVLRGAAADTDECNPQPVATVACNHQLMSGQCVTGGVAGLQANAEGNSTTLDLTAWASWSPHDRARHECRAALLERTGLSRREAERQAFTEMHSSTNGPTAARATRV